MLPLLHGSVVVCVVGAGCAGTRTQYRDVSNEELTEAVNGAGEHSLDRHARQAAAVAAAAGAGAGVASSSGGGGGGGGSSMHLGELDLSNRSLSDRAEDQRLIAGAITDAIATATLALTSITTQQHQGQAQQGQANDDEGVAMAMGMGMGMGPGLKVVNLSRNSIGVESVRLLSESLFPRCFKTLRSVNLRGNRLGGGGMWVLANLLVQQGGGGGGGSGAAAAAAAAGAGAGLASASCQITDLDVSENKLGDVGARALGLVLNDNKSLLRLVVEGNAIGDGGCVALAGGLGYNATLTELRLGGNHNQLGEVGVEALMAAVERQRQQQRRRQQSLRVCDVGDAAGAEQLQLVLQPPY